MEGEANNEFQDWEVLHNSDTSQVDSAGSDRSPRNFEGIEGDSEGMIRSDYFSLENKERYARTVSEGGDSVDSDNPSWIDPGSETQYAGRNSGEFWSDSGSDRSEERKFGDFDGKQELGLAEIGKSPVDFEGIEEMKGGSKSLGKFVAGEGEFSGLDGKRELGSAENEKIQVDFLGIEEMKGGGENLGKFVAGENKISDFDVKYELGSLGNEKIQVGFEEFGEIQTRDKDLGKGGDALVSMKFGGVKEESEMDINDYAKQREGSEIVGDVDGGNENAVIEKGNENVEVELAKSDAESALGEGEKRRVVWWKVPIELLKFCVFRVSPIWSFSMAAAVMGFLIIGRRLYKMKRKSQSLQLKVTVDDKKVSQFMSRAARLNEAFSVVRRVPIIRPSLPGAGLTPWPVMSMR